MSYGFGNLQCSSCFSLAEEHKHSYSCQLNTSRPSQCISYIFPPSKRSQRNKMGQWKLLSVGTWALPSMRWVPGNFDSQTWALGKNDWAACWRGTSSSSDTVWADLWREGGGAKKKPQKNRVWVRGSSFAAGGRAVGAPTASVRGSVRGAATSSTAWGPCLHLHRVSVALPPPPFPAPCHGHNCTSLMRSQQVSLRVKVFQR